MTGNKCFYFRTLEGSDYFPRPNTLFASFILTCVFITKAIIMNFSEDRDVGILYLSTRFKFDRFTYKRDLFSDKQKLETHITTHTETETDTLPI